MLGGGGLTGFVVFGANYLGRRSSDSLQPSYQITDFQRVFLNSEQVVAFAKVTAKKTLFCV
jgi:hypothetical protein